MTEDNTVDLVQKTRKKDNSTTTTTTNTTKKTNVSKLKTSKSKVVAHSSITDKTNSIYELAKKAVELYQDSLNFTEEFKICLSDLAKRDENKNLDLSSTNEDLIKTVEKISTSFFYARLQDLLLKHYKLSNTAEAGYFLDYVTNVLEIKLSSLQDLSLSKDYIQNLESKSLVQIINEKLNLK